MTATKHKGLPISGHDAQSDETVRLVDEFKRDEERLLRKLDALGKGAVYQFRDRMTGEPKLPGAGRETEMHISGIDADPRWLAIAKTHFEQGFMALERAVLQPQRIPFPEDGPPAAA